MHNSDITPSVDWFSGPIAQPTESQLSLPLSISSQPQQESRLTSAFAASTNEQDVMTVWLDGPSAEQSLRSNPLATLSSLGDRTSSPDPLLGLDPESEWGSNASTDAEPDETQVSRGAINQTRRAKKKNGQRLQNNRIEGTSRDDILNASKKRRNRLLGGKGNDKLFANKRDWLFGEDGDDTLSALNGKRQNVLKGGQGRDTLLARKKDKLFGNGGADRLDASQGKGQNKLWGNAGRDSLFAGKRDRLDGGRGQDVLWAGTGKNVLKGGKGGDRFWIASGELPSEVNTIRDFKSGQDTIGLRDIDGVRRFKDLDLIRQGNDTVIEVKGGAIALLKNISPEQLSAADFVFAPKPKDTTAPKITVSLADDTGSSATDGITSNPTITGTVKDKSAIASLRVGFANTPVADYLDITSSLSNGQFSFSRTVLEQLQGGSLADGTYTLTLIATDKFDNQSTPQNLSFTLDSTAPNLNITSNLEGASITPTSRLQGTVNDDGADITALSYRFDDGDPISVSLDASGTFDQVLDLTGLAIGQHTLTVVATDEAGNSSTQSFNIQQENDTVSPTITAALVDDTGVEGEDTFTSNPSIAGTVTDTSVISRFRAGFGSTASEGFVDILTTLQPDGCFVLDAATLATINGGVALEDGAYTLNLIATDTPGNVSETFTFEFTLDRTAPKPFPGRVTELDNTLDVAFDEAVNTAAFVAESYGLVVASGDDVGRKIAIATAAQVNDRVVRLTFAEPLTSQASYTLAIDSAIQDLAGNALVDNTTVEIVVDPPTVELHPIHGEERVALNRKTVIRFENEVDPSTVTDETVYLIANEEKLAGRLEVSSTNKFATFIPTEPLPASTEVRVMVNGDEIKTLNGVAFDGNLDGLAGGMATADFTTVPLTRIEGTNIFGYVYDSYNRNPDGSDKPVVGATIRVDGLPDVVVVTDENGYFKLEDLPAPDVYVFIDGSTATDAPEGTQYASLGKPFHSVPGQEVQLKMDGEPFDIYLPPMAMGDVKALSETEETPVGFGAGALALLQETLPEVDSSVWEAVEVKFPAGSARDDAGNAATQAMIVPVEPERLPAPPPAHLDPKLVISIQAGGENGFNREADGGSTYFDVPAPVVFPNLDGLAAGEKATLFSFDHEAGHWLPIGLGTVSEDGSIIESDPGVGILAPGWHFVSPPLNWGAGGGKPSNNSKFEFNPLPPEIKFLVSGDEDSFSFTFTPPPGPGDKVGKHEVPQGDTEPKRIVDIKVEGKYFSEFYDNSGRNGLKTETIVLKPGDTPVSRSAILRTLEDIQKKANGKVINRTVIPQPFDSDVLYGASITVVDTLVYADNSREVNAKTFLPYLYVDQSDDISTDRILKFPDLVHNGDIEFRRFLELRTEGAPDPSLIFQGRGQNDYQSLSRITLPNGSIGKAIEFNPSAAGPSGGTMNVEVDFDGAKLTSSDGPDILGFGKEKQHINVNTNELKNILQNNIFVETRILVRFNFDSGNDEFQFTFGNQPTVPLKLNSDAQMIQRALEALPNIKPGDVIVRSISSETKSGISPFEPSTTTNLLTYTLCREAL